LPALVETECLFGVNDQERIAGNGIERLNPAADQYRNFCEVSKVDAIGGLLRRNETGADLERRQYENETGEKTFHVKALLLRAKPTR